jgi:di/tricarboxylate transporter
MLAAVVALAVTGNTDPAALLAAAIGAVCPTALRYFNPKDLAFGRGKRQS